MSNISVSGSCLCGEVTYTAEGDAQNFFYCHCKRCRKSTGTGHASNILLVPGTVSFLSGESNLSEYQPGDAKFFTNVFCSRCGSRLPRFSPERNIVVLPAGSLDEEPGVLPTGRIFKRSAAAWSCDTSDIPFHDEYPPRN